VKPRVKRFACDRCGFRSAEAPAYARPAGFVAHYRAGPLAGSFILCEGNVREAETLLRRVAYAVAWGAVVVGYSLRGLRR
jgi:hypothetical protein